MGNPLAPLMNAQYAGALGGCVCRSSSCLEAELTDFVRTSSFNPFAQMGVNTNDPNYMQNMMNNPEVQAQMNRLLQDPAILDQIVQLSPSPRRVSQTNVSPHCTDRLEPSAAANGPVRSPDHAGTLAPSSSLAIHAQRPFFSAV